MFFYNWKLDSPEPIVRYEDIYPFTERLAFHKYIPV